MQRVHTPDLGAEVEPWLDLFVRTPMIEENEQSITVELYRKIRTAMPFIDRVVCLKILIVGSACVGKSTLATALRSLFDLIGIRGVTVSLHLDNDKFRVEEKSFVIFIYDICSEESFNNCLQSRELLLQMSSTSFESLLVGNKLDFEYWRRISISSAMQHSSLKSIPFVEISAKVGIHVDIVCDMILKCLFQELRESRFFDEVIDRLRCLQKLPGVIVRSSDLSDEDNVVFDEEAVLDIASVAIPPPCSISCHSIPSPQIKTFDAIDREEVQVGGVEERTSRRLQKSQVIRGIKEIDDSVSRVMEQPTEIDFMKRSVNVDLEMDVERICEKICEEMDAKSPVATIWKKWREKKMSHDDIDMEKMARKKKVEKEKNVGIGSLCAFCGNNINRVFSWILQMLLRKELFDNVLADTENAFQTAAKGLDFLVGIGIPTSLYLYLSLPILWIVSIILCIFFTVVLILPSFFTLLIVRTTTIEKESKNFGIRQEVIRTEKPMDSFVRWVRIVLRALPMTFYILVTPYLLIYHYFPGATEGRVTASLVGFTTGIIILQTLGTVRAYYSWKMRDIKIPPCPDLYPSDSKSDNVGDSGRCCSFSKCFLAEKVQPKPKPPLRNSFNAISLGGLILIGSLSLEYFQMATFALQNNPYEPDSSSTVSDPGSTPRTNYWGSELFSVLYVTIYDNIQFITMWFAVGLVMLLVLLFSLKFLFELRQYGFYLRDTSTLDEAKDHFFFSFTGSVVYGHGKPSNLSRVFRTVVAVLSDGLFLVISLRLLDTVACDYQGTDESVLIADPRITCWKGRHSSLAVCALTAYAIYVPLSIMIAPMLLEKDSSDTSGENVVSYAQLYLMIINVVKSVMLLVASLGPRTTTSLVASTCTASFIMGTMTILWFHTSEVKQYVEIQPASIAFINVWKTSSYFSSVITAFLVIAAHTAGPAKFPESSLSVVLSISWFLVIASCFLYYKFWTEKHERFLENEKCLIEYPFVCKNILDSELNGKNGALLSRNHLCTMNVPGFITSPWLDQHSNLSLQDTISSLVLDIWHGQDHNDVNNEIFE